MMNVFLKVTATWIVVSWFFWAFVVLDLFPFLMAGNPAETLRVGILFAEPAIFVLIIAVFAFFRIIKETPND